ncbi:carbon-nitrogen hydrolase family protein [Roseovarius aestuariivivens]|uniref:carbon-nitrogen hydrolase family protein n=1 Tax=Roseovarius aestuariivivens TaxID=1888910 RepID=UPI001080A0AA|nr:carbon-nitrogen hydrolase family protein [Roseovarius aestuariivivens]
MKLVVFQGDAAPVPPEKRLVALEQALIGHTLDLVLCPELFLTGYDAQADFAHRAEATDGPFARAIADLARRTCCAICYGYPERAGDRLYNSAALIGPSGDLIANHRKRLPSPGSFEVETFARGPAVTFADVNGWKIAILICYEVEFPESLRQAALGGAQLVLVPTALGADWGVVAEHVVPTRAFENGVWLAYADHAGSCGDLGFYGGSRIADPWGNVVAQTDRADTLITAHLSRDSVASAQSRLPYLRDCSSL